MSLARQRVAVTAAAVQTTEAFAHASTLAALAGAAVACRALPPKLNGVVQVLAKTSIMRMCSACVSLQSHLSTGSRTKPGSCCHQSAELCVCSVYISSLVIKKQAWALP